MNPPTDYSSDADKSSNCNNKSSNNLPKLSLTDLNKVRPYPTSGKDIEEAKDDDPKPLPAPPLQHTPPHTSRPMDTITPNIPCIRAQAVGREFVIEGQIVRLPSTPSQQIDMSHVSENIESPADLVERESSARYSFDDLPCISSVYPEIEMRLNSPRFQADPTFILSSQSIFTSDDTNTHDIPTTNGVPQYHDIKHFPDDSNVRVSETTAYAWNPVSPEFSMMENFPCINNSLCFGLLMCYQRIYSMVYYYCCLESEKESVFWRVFLTVATYMLVITFYVVLDDYYECLAQVHDDQINHCDDHEVVGSGVPMGILYILSLKYAWSSKYYNILLKQTYKQYFKDYFHTICITKPHVFHIVECYHEVPNSTQRVTRHVEKRPYFYDQCHDVTNLPNIPKSSNLLIVESEVSWTISNDQLQARFNYEQASFLLNHVHCDDAQRSSTECEIEGMVPLRICCMNPESLSFGIEYGWYVYVFMSFLCLHWLYVLWFNRQCQPVKVTFIKSIMN